MTTLTASLPRPLTIFYADAWMSGSLGLSLVLFAEPLYALVGGGPTPTMLRCVGLALLPWGAHNWFTSRPASPRRRDVLAQLVGDTLWILGSLGVLFVHFGALNEIGRTLHTGQIVGVLGVLLLKLRVWSTLPRS